jgi:hypothetical protein
VSKKLIFLEKFTKLFTFAPINNMVVSIGTMGFGSMPHKERNIITPTTSYVQKKKLDWESSLPIKVSRKVTISFTPNPLCFHPLSPFSVVSTK